MFVCDLCGLQVEARIPSRRVCVERRPRIYPVRTEVNRPALRLVKGKWRVVKPDDEGGHGREIVKEALACPACAKSREPLAPEPASERRSLRLRIAHPHRPPLRARRKRW